MRYDIALMLVGGCLERERCDSTVGVIARYLYLVACDSGKWCGNRPIRSNLPQTIYVPALVATRFNPRFKAKYQALIAAGKPPTIAIVVIMRKLVILANTPMKAGRNWHPKAT